MEEHIIEPMGFVAEVAREYARIRNEMGPKPQAAPVLDEKALRRKRKQEKAEEDRRARAIACVQYQKLLDQKAYVNSVYKHMEEMGYFDEVQNLDDEDAEAGDTENEDDDGMDKDEDGDEQDILEDCGYETVDMGETYLDLEEVGRRRARVAERALNARYFSNEFVQGSSRTES